MTIINNVPKLFTITEPWTASTATYDAHIQAPDRFSIENVNGAKNALFVCQPDDMLSSGGERAEIILGTWSNSRDWMINGSELAVEYYRIRVKLQSPWERPDFNASNNRWGCVFQAHSPFAVPPPLALHAEDDFKLFVLGGDMDNLGSANGGFVPLIDNALVVDTWVDFVIEMKWSPNADGYAVLYRKDDGASSFKMLGEARDRITMQWKTTPKMNLHYFKCGYYRSQSNHTNTVRLAPLIRTSSRAVAFA